MVNPAAEKTPVSGGVFHGSREDGGPRFNEGGAGYMIMHARTGENDHMVRDKGSIRQALRQDGGTSTCAPQCSRSKVAHGSVAQNSANFDGIDK